MLDDKDLRESLIMLITVVLFITWFKFVVN